MTDKFRLNHKFTVKPQTLQVPLLKPVKKPHAPLDVGFQNRLRAKMCCKMMCLQTCSKTHLFTEMASAMERFIPPGAQFKWSDFEKALENLITQEYIKGEQDGQLSYLY